MDEETLVIPCRLLRPPAPDGFHSGDVTRFPEVGGGVSETATFMPELASGDNGWRMHTRRSLWNNDTNPL